MPPQRDGEPARRPPPIRKNLGQHFLNDPRILGRIVDALELSDGETVVEIGPGRGSLTALLVERAKRLVLIEYDRALAAMLREKYASVPSVRVIEADVLTVNLGDAADGPYVLVGNVPYYITTPILFHALQPPRPRRAVYLIQREVADRVVASAGSDEYGALSANVQAVASAKVLFRVPAGAFVPPPKVESAVIRVEPLTHPIVGPDEEARFRRFVIDAFGMRRKQMRRVVRELCSMDADAADAALTRAGIDPMARPETLTAAQFAALVRAL